MPTKLRSKGQQAGNANYTGGPCAEEAVQLTYEYRLLTPYRDHVRLAPPPGRIS